MADVLPLQYFLNQDDPLWNQRMGGIGGASLGALWDRAVANNATQGKSPGTVGKDPFGRYVGPATGGPVYPGMPGGVPTLPWQQIPMRPRTDVMGTTWPMLGQGAASQASQTALGGAQIAPEGALADFPMQDMGALPPDRYAGTKQFDLTGEESGVNSDMLTPNTTQIDSGMPQPNRTQLTGQGWGQYPGYTPPQQQGGGISQALGQDNNAGLWGLVAAGLGILANNTGHYGQAGPAIGKGGLIGLDTFLQQRQVATQNAAQQQRLAMAQQELEQRNNLINAQIGNYKSEEAKRAQEIADAQRNADVALATQKYYATALAGMSPEQAAAKLEDPKFHHAMAMQLNAIGAYGPAANAMKQAEEIRKGLKESWKAVDMTSGGDTTTTKLLNAYTGETKDFPNASPTNKKPLVSVDNGQNKALSPKIAEQIDASFSRANDAVNGEAALQQLEQGLNNPKLISGIGANQRLTLSQIGQMFGGDGEDVAVTRKTIQGFAELALQSRGLLKGQGQVTENEQKLLDRARSGDVTMTIPEMKSLVGVFHRINRAMYDSHVDFYKRGKNLPGISEQIDFYAPPEWPTATQSPATSNTPASMYRK